MQNKGHHGGCEAGNVLRDYANEQVYAKDLVANHYHIKHTCGVQEVRQEGKDRLTKLVQNKILV